jgi:hypothetical protein
MTQEPTITSRTNAFVDDIRYYLRRLGLDYHRRPWILGRCYVERGDEPAQVYVDTLSGCIPYHPFFFVQPCPAGPYFGRFFVGWGGQGICARADHADQAEFVALCVASDYGPHYLRYNAVQKIWLPPG